MDERAQPSPAPIEQDEYPSASQAPDDPPHAYASFHHRFLAYFLDNTLIVLFTFTVTALGVRLFEVNVIELSLDEIGRLAWMIWALQVLATLGYFTILIGGSGRTVGKRVMCLKVVRTDGSPVSYGRALARSLGYYASAFLLYLGFVFALVDTYHQALHDKIADTVVVEIE